MDVSFCMKSYDPPFNEERMPQRSEVFCKRQYKCTLSPELKTSDVQEFPQDFFSLTTCLRSRDLSPTRCSRRVPHGQTLKETA